MSGFTLFPAIDVREGCVVRLHQGDYAQEVRYPGDPLSIAQRYAQAGADWLHLVDLDAAREGGYGLAPLLGAIRKSTPLRIQTGGGVRSEADVAEILAAGADRVVVGSLAVRNPGQVMEWLQRFGAERITVALDARQVEGRWTLPTSGWTKNSGAVLEDLLTRYAEAGLCHALCTDIDRDGMLAGPNLALYRLLVELTPHLRVQASGGMRGVADISAVREAGCGGAVLGKALLEDRFDLAEALREERQC